MTRWALLGLPAVVVTACATARAETSDWATDLAATIATSTTTGVVETAPVPTEATTVGVDVVAARTTALLAPPGVVIPRPAGFSSIADPLATRLHRNRYMGRRGQARLYC